MLHFNRVFCDRVGSRCRFRFANISLFLFLREFLALQARQGQMIVSHITARHQAVRPYFQGHDSEDFADSSC